MPRVTRGARGTRKRKRILKMAEGYQGARGRLLRSARVAVERALPEGSLCSLPSDERQRQGVLPVLHQPCWEHFQIPSLHKSICILFKFLQFCQQLAKVLTFQS